MRFSRLRSTAPLAHFLEMANPNRAKSKSLVFATKTVKKLSAYRFDLEKTKPKSDGLSRRAWRGKLVDLGLAFGGTATGFQALVLWNQMSPALGAARLEYLPAVAGGHPCPETVGACSFDAAGLKGSLHSLNLLWNLAGLPGVLESVRGNSSWLPRKRSQIISF